MNEQVPASPHPDGTPAIGQPPLDPKTKYPVGLILIIILTGMGMVGSLMGVFNPVMVIGTHVVTGFPAFVYGLIQMGVYIALFVWLIQRKERGRILGIAVSVYHMFHATITFLPFVCFRDETMAAYDTAIPGYSEYLPSGFLFLTLGFTAVLSWLVGPAVILYLHFKKRHFRT